ncbi:DUF192 domain-containing protein [Candidatus Woesearchaeota archaeon]|nr:DUF192 domain-containing protein [Candidatus Woesearchaeota archaeon]
MKSYKFVIFALLLLVLIGCSSSNYVEIKGKKINVEIADTREEQLKGLMYREKLDENTGMLFVYNDSRVRNFWMANMQFPLDMLFINESKSIIKIEYAGLCENKVCNIHSSDIPAMYVLEVNANFSEENNIKTGDLVSINI